MSENQQTLKPPSTWHDIDCRHHPADCCHAVGENTDAVQMLQFSTSHKQCQSLMAKSKQQNLTFLESATMVMALNFQSRGPRFSFTDVPLSLRSIIW